MYAQYQLAEIKLHQSALLHITKENNSVQNARCGPLQSLDNVSRTRRAIPLLSWCLRDTIPTSPTSWRPAPIANQLTDQLGIWQKQVSHWPRLGLNWPRTDQSIPPHKTQHCNTITSIHWTGKLASWLVNLSVAFVQPALGSHKANEPNNSCWQHVPKQVS